MVSYSADNESRRRRPTSHTTGLITHHCFAECAEGEAHQEAVGDGNDEAQRFELERKRRQPRRAACANDVGHLRHLDERAACEDGVAQPLHRKNAVSSRFRSRSEVLWWAARPLPC